MHQEIEFQLAIVLSNDRQPIRTIQGKTNVARSMAKLYLAAASTLMSKTLSLPGSTFKVNGLLIAS